MKYLFPPLVFISLLSHMSLWINSNKVFDLLIDLKGFLTIFAWAQHSQFCVVKTLLD